MFCGSDCNIRSDSRQTHPKQVDVHDMFALLQAYADYYDVMDMTEELVSGLVKAVKGSYQIQYHAGEIQHSSPDRYMLSRSSP